VPAEEGLPGTHVAIGGGNATHVAVDGVLEDRIESAEVPGACLLVHECAE
jgi:hypothetical protein